MESLIDRKQHLRERLWFIHIYADWVKKVPNPIWSGEQVRFIDSMMQSSKDYALSADKYLRMKKMGERQKRNKRQ